MITLNHDSWLHLYGVFNGLYLAGCLYVLFFSVSVFINKRQRYVSRILFMNTLLLASFALYALFYQKSYGAITTNAISPILFTIGKYTSPIALMLMTYLIIESASYRSFRTMDFKRRYPFVEPAIHGFSLICLVTLFFIDNDTTANMVISIMFIPAILLGMFLVNLEFYKQNIRFLFIGLLIVALISDIVFIVNILPNDSEISIQNHMALHMFYGFTVLLVSFTIVRYGLEEAKRFYDIRQTDSLNLSNEMYRAVEKSEFFLTYQPKLDLTSNKIAGLEALIRWQHPSKGVIPPLEFIPAAEQTQMIDRICRWTIEHAIIQAQKLAQMGLYLPIAINFSTKNITTENIQYLANCLEKYALPPELIIIEITESVILRLEHKESKALNMLQELGVKLSLDDYGTGFSSLNYINLLSLNELKIDKSFIRDLEHNPDHRIIVESTLQMSHGLKLSVVAEGVENDTIRGILGDMGCDMVQGFGIQKPMQVDELDQWITSHPDFFQKNTLNYTLADS